MKESKPVYLIRNPGEHFIQGVESLLKDEKEFVDISTPFSEKVDEGDISTESPSLLLIFVGDDVEYAAEITHKGHGSRLRLRNPRQIAIPSDRLPEPNNIHVAYDKISQYLDGEGTESKLTTEDPNSSGNHSKIERSDSHTENNTSGESEVELGELRRQAKKEGHEKVTIKESSNKTKEYARSQAVKKYVKARADGVCEGCGSQAPFESISGEPYLHAHHVNELSSGGSDTPDSVIALCPNCHYRVHHGKDGKQYNQLLSKKLDGIESK